MEHSHNTPSSTDIWAMEVMSQKVDSAVQTAEPKMKEIIDKY
jgi:hypothetical protein